MSESCTLTMPAQCDLRSARALRDAMLDALDRASEITLDCAAIERADMAFVQLVLAAGQSAARRGATLVLTSRTAGLDAAHRRAGLDPSGPPTPVH